MEDLIQVHSDILQIAITWAYWRQLNEINIETHHAVQGLYWYSNRSAWYDLRVYDVYDEDGHFQTCLCYETHSNYKACVYAPTTDGLSISVTHRHEMYLINIDLSV